MKITVVIYKPVPRCQYLEPDTRMHDLKLQFVDRFVYLDSELAVQHRLEKKKPA